MISSYNQYVAPAQGPTGWGSSGNLGVSGPELAAYFTRQYTYAAAGTALASIDAEQHPPDELTGAANTAGAYYRVAYWLATGVRLLNGTGAPFGRRKELLFKALAANASASARLGMAYNPVTWLFSGNETPQDIQAIFEDGARTAEAYGLPTIAQRLRQLGSARSTQQQQSATAGNQPITDLPANVTGGYLRNWKPVGMVGAVLALGAIVLAYKYRGPILRSIAMAGKALALVL